MNELVLEIIKQLIQITNTKFSNNFSSIIEVKLFLHNLIFLLISHINCKRLNVNKPVSLKSLLDLNLLPSSIIDFENENKELIESFINEFSDVAIIKNIGLTTLREKLLSIEICISKNNIFTKTGKNIKGISGSYYTPESLAAEVVNMVNKKFHLNELIVSKNNKIKIADLSCGCGEFFSIIQEYLYKNYNIEYKKSSLLFWGIDIDPIALQIAVCNLLQHANTNDWKEISNHFRIGNPLISNSHESSLCIKNELFATNRIYNKSMGLNFSLLNFKDFDIILGNPPWTKIRFEERKFFSNYVESISNISKKNERICAINKLAKEWPELYKWYTQLLMDYNLINKKDYKHPLIHRSVNGELNTYALFTELAYNLLNEDGITCLIVKTSLVTTPAQKILWTYFLSHDSIESLYFFDNKFKIFDIDSREKFSVLTLTRKPNYTFDFSAGLLESRDLQHCQSIKILKEDVYRINPITNMMPNVSNTSDIKFLINAHSKLQLFKDVFPTCHFGRLIHLTAHADKISTEKNTNNIPIYEGKFIEQYDARYSSFAHMNNKDKYGKKSMASKNNVKNIPESRFFVDSDLWEKFLKLYPESYSLCWRSLTSVTNARTMIAMILPTCPTCQSIQMLQISDYETLILILALFNSITFDFLVRLKMPGIDLTQNVVKQIPVPSKKIYSKKLMFNNKTETLKKHILSYACYLLSREKRLIPLIDKLKNVTYKIEDSSIINAKRNLDKLFAKAYNLTDTELSDIIKTFSNY